MYNTALWPLLPSCVWSTTDWFGEIKHFHEPLNYGAHDANASYDFFAFFKNLKSSFSADNMPVYALDVFIECATKIARMIPSNTEKIKL